MVEQAVIIGLGLIGGSLAAALKRGGLAAEIVGVDNAPTLARARDLKLIDHGQASAGGSLATADVVFLATPISAVLGAVEEIIEGAGERTLLTDVGSTKTAIVNAAWRSRKGRRQFIGGHPMAGTERSGLDSSSASLFQDAPYLLVEHEDADAGKSDLLRNLIAGIGARSVAISAEAHDRIVALVSHLPQVLSVVLMDVLFQKHQHSGGLLQLSGPGLKDLTRLADSPYGMWQEILDTNQGPISSGLDSMIARLTEFKASLEQGDSSVFFENAHEGRKILSNG